jgi:predicted peptidase
MNLFFRVFFMVSVCLGMSLTVPAELTELPADLSSFKGDPDRGPEPRAKHAATRTYPTLEPIRLSNGDPIRDYGHFRMSEKVANRKRSPFYANLSKEEMKAGAEHWERHAFEDGKKLHYSLARPDAGARRPPNGFPLVVLQPGIGGIGKKSVGGNAWVTETYRKHFPAYVVYLHPQDRTHEYTTRPDGVNSADPTEMVDAYIAAIENLLKTLPDVDNRRVYLFGHSMGGSSTWFILDKRPDLVAAAVPMAGLPPLDMEQAERMKNVPIWMIVGNDDPWSGSFPYIRAYQNLVAAGADKVRFWEIQDIGHSGRFLNAWPLAAWAFHQRR